MKKPILLNVDDDPQVLRALRQDLRSRYKKDYQILSTDNPNEALESLKELKNRGEEVALLLSDQRMPQLDGVDFLEKAIQIYPKAKRVLLTAYSDTNAAIKAINAVNLDHYLMKPWDPPEEKLYPTLDDLLDDWWANFKPKFKGLRILGYQYSHSSHELKEYLSGNLFSYAWLDMEKSEEAQQLFEQNDLKSEDLPALFMEDGTILKRPEKAAVAERLGLNVKAKADIYDVAIIGAGPAGLAAAVYGASEGLKTLLIEKKAPGGQAGTSSRIENYLGFPKGLSGSDLARRALSQAERLGAEFLTPAEVKHINIAESHKVLELIDGQEIICKSLVIATGVDYRKLETKGVSDFTGAGVYYGAATTEANACSNEQVFVVGGGNSAGQAAMYLSQFARKVNILIRRDDLTATMSAYLIEQIESTPNIQLWPQSEVAEAQGDERLEKLIIKNRISGEFKEEDAAAMFIFIGAKPFTDWIPERIGIDGKGFIHSGQDVVSYASKESPWTMEREPYSLETSVPGVFAAGDVRSGAMNRVASAVGEGAMAISFVHRYLTEI